MEIISTAIPDVKILNPKVWSDARGYFYESYNQKVFNDLVGPVDFIQDNQSFSTKDTFRGLHYQVPPFEQAKLVRVIQGEVIDFALDIRKGSPTFGHSVAVTLSESNKYQLYIPRGFAHGFLVTSEVAIFQYKVDNFYSKECDRGIYFNDPAISLPLPRGREFLLSEKDASLKGLSEADLFSYGG